VVRARARVGNAPLGYANVYGKERDVMCGIAGVACFSGLSPSAPRIVGAMTKSIAYRGPDGEGNFFDKHVSFGHRRLAILDAQGGGQPFYSEDGKVVVTFNGEIYNHRALRTRLRNLGHRMHGYCDGEVLPHLYEEYGTAFPQHLDGMFSVAIYDEREKRLILARDRTGEKPLYYVLRHGTLYFASSVGALWHTPDLKPALSTQGIVGYFAHTQALSPASMFDHVSKLPAGHFLSFGDGGIETIAPYWQLNCCEKIRVPYEEAVESLDLLLGTAVETSLDGDYPIALTLSGGVDSSLVLSYAQEAASGVPPACFSLGAHDADEEFERAQFVARAHGLEIDRFLIPETTYGDIVAALRSFDEPVNVYDSIYLLEHSRHIAARYRVAITGNGADEAFGGYAGYLTWASPDATSRHANPRVEIELFLARTIAADANQLFNAQTARYCLEYDASLHLAPLNAVACYDTAVDGRLCYDLFVGMSHCASLGDVVGMAHALEYRSPFLRRSILEFAASLPVEWKVCARTRSNKPILKTLAQRRIPRFQSLSPKLGCGHNVDRCALMRQNWRADVESALVRTRELTACFLDPDKVSQLWTAFVSGRTTPDVERRALKLMLLVAWIEAHASVL
jgi:asparagine synthase (glutamine-hydrolysing)